MSGSSRRKNPTSAQIVATILNTYQQGWFPMADDQGTGMDWVAPHQRCLMPLDTRFHISRSLRKTIASKPFELSTDTAFGRVIRACGAQRAGGCWLSDQIIAIFDLMHEAHHAHSIEAWFPGQDRNDEPVGGIYGLAIGGAFCAESMFCRPERGGTDASKVCLCALVSKLRADGYVLLDTQIFNEHTSRFGAEQIPHEQYLDLLAKAIKVKVRPWLESPLAHPFSP